MPAYLRKIVSIGVLLLFLFINSTSSIFAQNLGQLTPTQVPGAPTDLTTCSNYRPDWRPDTEVTMLGKAAERSRQLLYWVLSPEHQPINNAPVLNDIWKFSLMLVITGAVLVIVAFGFSYILLKRRAMTIDLPPIIIKIAAVLLWAAFSYVLVLGLIQISEIMMRFFIETVGGQNLFNIIFSGVSKETNYIDFIGYRDISFCSQESGKTAMFLINMTNLTYNVMAILLILRNIILWFLLVLSPFLAILMPFVFIRNIGWIWIGVFFQWLFYGPLFALFLSGITKIWVKGIPYGFDFGRVNTDAGQVYRTSINILYGGPAQTLAAGNSANYIDTYAEYVIALVMLWAAIVLPWLLLRIFRDYCCAAIAAAANTLSAIFDRIRQYPPPDKPMPSTPSPTTTAGMAFDLPFRKSVSDVKKVENVRNIENIREISRMSTESIASTMNMSVSSIKDLTRLDMDRLGAETVRSTLNKIGNPNSIVSPMEREKFTSVRSELVDRATRGDAAAQSILSASGCTKDQIMAVPTVSQLRSIPTAGGVKTIGGIRSVPIAGTIAKKTAPSVSLEEYEEVKKMWLNHYREAPVPVSEKIKDRTRWTEEDIKTLTNTINLLASANPEQKQKGLENVAAILPFLLLGGFSEVETMMYLRAKLEAAKQAQAELEAAFKAKEAGKKEASEDENLVEVGEKKEEEKAKEAEGKMNMTMDENNVDKKEDLPKEEKKS